MSIVKSLKSLVPDYMKARVKLAFQGQQNNEWLRYQNMTERLVFVFLAGFYQNLGDMAITYAQVRFLEDCFPDSVVVPVPAGKTYAAVNTIRKFIKPFDIITLIGGGNMSDRYQSLEDCRLFVVKSFPNNKVISFPQTIDFQKRDALIKSKSVYSSHKDLSIFVREYESLCRAEKYFPQCRIKACPDIALSIQYSENTKERSRVLCCLRSDKEQNITQQKKNNIISTLQAQYGEIILRDTTDVAIEDCQPASYEKTLMQFLKTLSSCRVVVTDRLHCMILCAVTKTPCVAIDNSNHKVSGVYNAWLKNLDFITVIESGKDEPLIQACERVEKGMTITDRINFEKLYDPLRSALVSKEKGT